jgi:glycosyltransferase involved in cell wall biosynthesis
LRLLLLGNGSEAGKMLEFVEVHGLSRVVRTLNPRVGEEMPKWFRAADTYISCAQSDGTSVSLLEAMATGLPLIVTDIPSNREWVVEGSNGWLAPANSAEKFADRMLRASRLSREQRSLFSERNRRLVDERADWDRNFPRLLEMYERITAMSICR